jgi:CHAD domain-containing protein
VAFELRRDQGLTRNVRRTAREQAEKALQALAKDAERRDQVHDARTSVKKLRALLRLLAPSLENVHRREDRRLARLGQALSQLRDAEALIETFDGLFARFEPQLGPSLRQVRERLAARLGAVESRLDLPARLKEARAEFRDLVERSRRWRVRKARRRGGWAALEPGVTEGYRRARRTMARAYRHGDSDAFHGWRKAVKSHAYQMHLLGDLWPLEMTARHEALDGLGKGLGEDHDLAVFSEVLRREHGCFDNPGDRQVLLGLIEQRQAALRQELCPLGALLFAERPSAFARRLGAYWRVWRAGRESSADEQERRQAA